MKKIFTGVAVVGLLMVGCGTEPDASDGAVVEAQSRGSTASGGAGHECIDLENNGWQWCCDRLCGPCLNPVGNWKDCNEYLTNMCESGVVPEGVGVMKPPFRMWFQDKVKYENIRVELEPPKCEETEKQTPFVAGEGCTANWNRCNTQEDAEETMSCSEDEDFTRSWSSTRSSTVSASLELEIPGCGSVGGEESVTVELGKSGSRSLSYAWGCEYGYVRSGCTRSEGYAGVCRKMETESVTNGDVFADLSIQKGSVDMSVNDCKIGTVTINDYSYRGKLSSYPVSMDCSAEERTGSCINGSMMDAGSPPYTWESVDAGHIADDAGPSTVSN
jgi:hypothetical protein